MQPNVPDNTGIQASNLASGSRQKGDPKSLRPGDHSESLTPMTDSRAASPDKAASEDTVSSDTEEDNEDELYLERWCRSMESGNCEDIVAQFEADGGPDYSWLSSKYGFNMSISIQLWHYWLSYRKRDERDASTSKKLIVSLGSKKRRRSSSAASMTTGTGGDAIASSKPVQALLPTPESAHAVSTLNSGRHHSEAPSNPEEPSAVSPANGQLRKYKYSQSSFLPTEALIAAFEVNPWPNEAVLNDIRQSAPNVTAEQIGNWFKRHRRNNGLYMRGVHASRHATDSPAPLSETDTSTSIVRGRGRGRGGGRPRGRGRGAGRGTRGTGLSHHSSLTKGSLIQDGDENDYGSTSDEEAWAGGVAEDFESPPNEVASHQVSGKSRRADFSPKRKGEDWLAAAAEDAAQASKAGRGASDFFPPSLDQKPQHFVPITRYSTHCEPGHRPLVYFSKPSPPRPEPTRSQVAAQASKAETS